MQLSISGKRPLATDFSAERSPEARHLAETALVWLIHALKDHDIQLIVLGGLVPGVLTRGQEPAVPEHLGTTDVDIYLAVHLDVDINLGALERALTNLGIVPDPKQAGWRWIATVEGAKVKLEFLCDLPNERAETAFKPAGCRELTALNLRGTGFVSEDWAWEEVTGTLPSGEDVSLRIRFAGLQGYLMSKVYVAKERGQAKDYYDLVYTLLFNKLGGPSEVGARMRIGKFGARINLQSAVWREIAARFQSVSDFGPKGYAEEAMRADPTADYSQLQQDAGGAVQEFLAELSRDD